MLNNIQSQISGADQIIAINPTTEDQITLPSNTIVGEIVIDHDSGEQFEVIAISNNRATLELVQVEEDWGE